MNLPDASNARNFLTICASQGGLCSMVLIIPNTKFVVIYLIAVLKQDQLPNAAVVRGGRDNPVRGCEQDGLWGSYPAWDIHFVRVCIAL
jgi:hypothetical protein